jgi:hypothetical protein
MPITAEQLGRILDGQIAANQAVTDAFAAIGEMFERHERELVELREENRALSNRLESAFRGLNERTEHLA